MKNKHIAQQSQWERCVSALCVDCTQRTSRWQIPLLETPASAQYAFLFSCTIYYLGM